MRRKSIWCQLHTIRANARRRSTSSLHSTKTQPLGVPQPAAVRGRQGGALYHWKEPTYFTYATR